MLTNAWPTEFHKIHPQASVTCCFHVNFFFPSQCTGNALSLKFTTLHLESEAEAEAEAEAENDYSNHDKCWTS